MGPRAEARERPQKHGEEQSGRKARHQKGGRSFFHKKKMKDKGRKSKRNPNFSNIENRRV